MATTAKSRRRSIFVVVIGLCCIGLAYAYVAFWLARPTGQGPAGPAVERGPFLQVWSQQPVHVIGIGDSITAGLGARTRAHSYFQRVLKNPDAEFVDMRGVCLSQVLPQLSSENIAVSGSTSIQHEEHLRERLQPQPDDTFGLVFMTTGGNDIIHNYGRSAPREGAMYGATLAEAEPWIASFEQRLGRMLEGLTELFPGGCEIYLCDIYDPTDGVGDAPSVFLPDWPDGLAIHSAYNDVLRRAARTRDHVFLVPLHLSRSWVSLSPVLAFPL